MFEAVRKDILKPLKNAGINSIIIGGYVRDTYLNKTYRDIDLVINYKDLKIAEKIFQTSTKLSPHYGKVMDHIDIMGTSNFKYGKWLINLILVGFKCDKIINFRRLIGNGICMCAVTDTEEYFDKIFYEDVKDQQITLIRNDWGYEASIKHWIKIHKKYPWPLRLQKGIY